MNRYLNKYRIAPARLQNWDYGSNAANHKNYRVIFKRYCNHVKTILYISIVF